eukprot:GILJ01001840.1.p1 GENE.GILJ01001840.1~~GILJ01001840.1.p1  ORF type:complete len:651 (-),score=128.19 GILJ01001840.1:140-1888(-)
MGGMPMQPMPFAMGMMGPMPPMAMGPMGMGPMGMGVGPFGPVRPPPRFPFPPFGMGGMPFGGPQIIEFRAPALSFLKDADRVFGRHHHKLVRMPQEAFNPMSILQDIANSMQSSYGEGLPFSLPAHRMEANEEWNFNPKKYLLTAKLPVSCRDVDVKVEGQSVIIRGSVSKSVNIVAPRHRQTDDDAEEMDHLVEQFERAFPLPYAPDATKMDKKIIEDGVIKVFLPPKDVAAEELKGMRTNFVAADNSTAPQFKEVTNSTTTNPTDPAPVGTPSQVELFDPFQEAEEGEPEVESMPFNPILGSWFANLRNQINRPEHEVPEELKSPETVVQHMRAQLCSHLDLPECHSALPPFGSPFESPVFSGLPVNARTASGVESNPLASIIQAFESADLNREMNNDDNDFGDWQFNSTLNVFNGELELPEGITEKDVKIQVLDGVVSIHAASHVTIPLNVTGTAVSDPLINATTHGDMRMTKVNGDQENEDEIVELSMRLPRGCDAATLSTRFLPANNGALRVVLAVNKAPAADHVDSSSAPPFMMAPTGAFGDDEFIDGADEDMDEEDGKRIEITTKQSALRGVSSA